MTHDGPRTNGEVPRTTATPSRTAPLLPDICYTLRRKVTAFLEQPSDDQLVRDTQAQARVAMGVIKEALQSYTYHLPPSPLPNHLPLIPPPTATTKSPSPTTAAKTASSSSSSSSPASPPRPRHRPNPPPPSPRRNASKQSTSRRPTPSRRSRPSSPRPRAPTTSTSSATRCRCAPRSRRTSATGRRCAPCSWARGGPIRTASFWSTLVRRTGIGRGL